MDQRAAVSAATRPPTLSGRITIVRQQPPAPIQWRCNVLRRRGVISNREGSPHDRDDDDASPRWGRLTKSTSPMRVATALRELMLLDPDCERLVFSMHAHHGGAVPHASEGDLEELIGGVAASHTTKPIDAASVASIPRSTHSTPQPKPSPAGDAVLVLLDLDVARVQRWCAARVPEHARHQVRVECAIAPRHLTLIERRALA